VAVLLVGLAKPCTSIAQESQPIRVLAADTENHFPDSLVFHLEVEANHPLTDIHLYFRSRGDPVVVNHPIEFEPDTKVAVSYTWSTSRMTVAPSTPVLYYWKLKDQAGNRFATPERTVYYDDLRFNWQELSDDELIVRWYEGDDEFGSSIYETARRALSRMKEQSGGELEYPVLVLLYANKTDFSAWTYYMPEWTGGLAFGPLGITAQIVPPNAATSRVQRVIPHEIAHLFFYQAVHGPWTFWPKWLSEGLARYYEFGTPDAALGRVASAARRGDLIPLEHLETGFSRDPGEARQAYDESRGVPDGNVG
jgi:hypothetical protein